MEHKTYAWPKQKVAQMIKLYSLIEYSMFLVEVIQFPNERNENKTIEAKKNQREVY